MRLWRALQGRWEAMASWLNADPARLSRRERAQRVAVVVAVALVLAAGVLVTRSGG